MTALLFAGLICICAACYIRLHNITRRLHTQQEIDRERLERLHLRVSRFYGQVWNVEQAVDVSPRFTDAPKFMHRQAD